MIVNVKEYTKNQILRKTYFIIQKLCIADLHYNDFDLDVILNFKTFLHFQDLLHLAWNTLKILIFQYIKKNQTETLFTKWTTIFRRVI